MNDLARRIDAILPLVAKPSRYLGNEFHILLKTPERGMVQWCLVMPEVYEIGMSHWGLKILYEVLNKRPDSLAERCYAPWFDMEAQLRRHEIPLFSLESKRPLSEFDLLGFSLQYELTYTNILNCLDLAGVPLRAEDRRDRDPLVIAGGPCVSNPEPLSDFMDLFLIGDGEEAVQLITWAYKQLRGRPRQEILREMAKLPGLYCPLMYESSYSPEGRLERTTPRYADIPKRVKRQFITDLDTAPVPEMPVVPLQGIVQDRLTVEVVRGCTQGCRFCQAGYLYRPIRERSIERILEIADQGIRNSGWDEVGLVSLSTADYTQLEPLAEVMNARFGRDKVAISLPSLRADSFGVGIADRVRETKKTGFTFAPEAGSERLRLAVNKIIRDEEFFAAARIAYERGWRLIKMYFMVGLPTETWEDVEGIAHFVEAVREIGRQSGTNCTVTAAVGAHVPKSHTPFQWDPFEDMESLRDKIQYLKRRIPSRWSRLKWHEVQCSHLEAIFSLGDRRLGRTLEHAFRRGARFDGWTEHLNYRGWLRSLDETGIDPTTYTRRKDFDETLPWDHIDIGVLKKWLLQERKKTDQQNFQIGQSLTADCRHGDCTACGIPGLPYDTELTPKLEPADFRRLMEKAEAAAPRREDHGVTWSVRIRYQKRGLCRFISHLEMTSVFARAFRMARIPLAFSLGHTPHPRFAFGPPLPVGIEGMAEAFDAELQEPWSTVFAERLNAVLPEGLRILDGRPLLQVPGQRRPSLAQLAQRAHYRLDLSRLPAATRVRIDELAARFEDLGSCVVERTYWSPAGSREIRDWESPMDPIAAAGVAEVPGLCAEASPAEDGLRELPAEEDPRESPTSSPELERVGRSPNSRRPRGKRKRQDRATAGDAVPRRVDLKRAVIRISTCEADLELELYLARADGQVANPKVVLERLFRLSPEEQALVSVVRTALLDERGQEVALPLLSPARRGGDPEIAVVAVE